MQNRDQNKQENRHLEETEIAQIRVCIKTEPQQNYNHYPQRNRESDAAIKHQQDALKMVQVGDIKNI